MNMYPTTEQISKALFESDPMNTCCKENDCYDEYDSVAAEVVQHLEEGATLKGALARAINEWFYDGEDLPMSEKAVKPTMVRLEQQTFA